MAKLVDTSGKISLVLSFHQRSKLITEYEDDINNWIPIDFEVNVFEESYKIYPEVNPSLNLFEINLMFSKLKSSIREMQLTNKFKKVEISTYEFYYELEFVDLTEDDWISCTVWTFEASRTNGNIYDVQRGFRFIVTITSLRDFVNKLEEELNLVLQNPRQKELN
ncbi:WapI family immunity protein [Paenibacillus eucommiae]|uniref:Uncharacterized protein n=1 Tax=Paenibacillus eucommiae TaxID=1355755 RepID=A0ABS4IPS4_9BACL|nr:hypothetical protein [Paenibacillus eucommiae]MBP1989569.1 hypothetical protein [Paenibacillus eucommiae]